MMKLNFDVVDFHAHVLPNADHGSPSVDTTLFQLRSAAENQVKRIIATPHFYAHRDSVDSFIQRRNCSYQELSPYLTPEMPEISLGAEVLICNGIENMPGLSRLFIVGTQTLLLELPFSDFQSAYIRSVYSLVRSGVEVVLAHAECYKSEYIRPLVECGAKIQINAPSVVKLFRDKRISRWIDSGIAVALGSDIHGKDKRAYPKFLRAIDKIGGKIQSISSYSDAIWEKSLPSINKTGIL